MSRARARARGEGSIYQRADGRWVASLRWPNGKRKYRYARSQRAARDQLIELQSLRRSGRPVPDDQVTVSDWLDRWMKRHVAKLRPRTQESYTHAVNSYIRPSLGKAKLLSLSVERVGGWLDDLIEQGVPLPTAKHSLVVLRIALKGAMREDLIARNPASLVEAPQYKQRKGNPLRGCEATTLLQAVRRHRLYALIVLALTSGLRRGELLGLTWGAIHVDERYLQVVNQLQREKGKGLVLVPTKTERSAAPVALTNMFLRALQAHRAQLIEDRMRTGKLWRGHDNPVASDALVFVTRWGTPLDGMNVWLQWSKMLAGAGIEHRRLHDSRHTTGTLLRALGVAPEVVQTVLRHARITTTLDTYVHTDLSQQHAAVAELDELLGGVLG